MDMDEHGFRRNIEKVNRRWAQVAADVGKDINLVGMAVLSRPSSKPRTFEFTKNRANGGERAPDSLAATNYTDHGAVRTQRPTSLNTFSLLRFVRGF